MLQIQTSIFQKFICTEKRELLKNTLDKSMNGNSVIGFESRVWRYVIPLTLKLMSSSLLSLLQYAFMFCFVGDQVGLKLAILLLQCSECWDYRHVPASPADNLIL
jgi:hypothetical protein